MHIHTVSIHPTSGVKTFGFKNGHLVGEVGRDGAFVPQAASERPFQKLPLDDGVIHLGPV